MARLRGSAGAAAESFEEVPKPRPPERRWLDLGNEALWTRLF
jgi:hypothetical protein